MLASSSSSLSASVLKLTQGERRARDDEVQSNAHPNTHTGAHAARTRTQSSSVAPTAHTNASLVRGRQSDRQTHFSRRSVSASSAVGGAGPNGPSSSGATDRSCSREKTQTQSGVGAAGSGQLTYQDGQSGSGVSHRTPHSLSLSPSPPSARRRGHTGRAGAGQAQGWTTFRDRAVEYQPYTGPFHSTVASTSAGIPSVATEYDPQAQPSLSEPIALARPWLQYRNGNGVRRKEPLPTTSSKATATPTTRVSATGRRSRTVIPVVRGRVNTYGNTYGNHVR